MGSLLQFMDERFNNPAGYGPVVDAMRGAAAATLPSWLGAPVDLMTAIINLPLGALGKRIEKPIGGSANLIEMMGLAGPQKAPGAPMNAYEKGMLASELAQLLSPLAVATGGKILGAMAQRNAGFQASKSPNILDAKPVPQRPFSDDYPNLGTGGGHGGGRLAVDVDGNPPSPTAFVAGRRVGGMVDEGLLPEDRARATELLGISRAQAPRSGPALGGDFGRYTHHDRRLTVDQSLPPEQADRVFSHELAHAIEKHTFGKAIPTTGLKKELAQIYSDQNTGWYVPKGKIGATPASFGYKGADTDGELIAEAIRAYMRDPNYMKTVAPKTAARIREYVNRNPNLMDIIQFNTVAPAAVGLGLLGAFPDDEQEM